ncbi:MAG: DinB family protein [Nitrospinae bacterium]|nr:DinB family protein [Nitrospinota bacterium]
MTEDFSTPGLDVFPEYSNLVDVFREETNGLPQELWEWKLPEKSWGAWSIKEQISHTAWIPYLFFLEFWPPVLYPGSLPRDKSLADTGGADRMLDPARFPGMSDVLAALDDACALCREVLSKETLATLREKELPRRYSPDRKWANGERVIDYFQNLVLPAHERGFRKDENDPLLYYQTLECTFRHILWEANVHLITIQEFKRVKGLPIHSNVPRDGYAAMLTWE